MKKRSDKMKSYTIVTREVISIHAPVIIVFETLAKSDDLSRYSTVLESGRGIG